MAHRTKVEGFEGAQRTAVQWFRLIVVLTLLYEVTSFQVHAPHHPGFAKKIAGSSMQGPLFTINMCTMQQGGQGVALRKVDLPGFDTWMKDRKIKAEKVSHAMFEVGDTEQRGLVACKDLAEGETIIEVPRDSAVCLLRSEKSPAADLSAFWEAHQQWYVRLGTKLLLERDKGASSAIRGYIDLLPSPKECEQFPVEWTPAEITQLRYQRVESSIHRQRAKWEKMQADFRRLCPLRSSWSDEDLRWAWHMCLSRAFAGNFGGGVLSFVPVVGLLVEMSALASSGAQSDYALIPVVDSCNHDGNLSATSLDFSPLSRTLTLKASKGGVRKGHQVYITYGALGNDELLQRFGFVEAACRHDSFVISKDELAAALCLSLSQGVSKGESAAAAAMRLQLQDGGRDAIESALIERGLGATCLDTLVLRRRGEVEKKVEVELALGMLFGDDSKGVAGLERASKSALHRVCQVLISQMTASEDEPVRKEVLLWRQAKCTVLREMLLSTANSMI